jgi:hypothetical protein
MDGRGEGLSQKHINAGGTKTYPMTTEANLTCKPKSKTPQVAGDPESVTGGDIRMQTAMQRGSKREESEGEIKGKR